MTLRRGRCLCGDVTFTAELAAADEDFSACHCTMCQRWSGGPWVEVGVRRLTFTGAGPAAYRSSDRSERLFCRRCGTSIGFNNFDGTETTVSISLFDPPLTGRLVLETYTDMKHPGLSFAGTHPRFTEREWQGQAAANHDGGAVGADRRS